MLESPSTTPTVARTPLTIGEVGFGEIPARITGNKLLLTFKDLTVGETYTLITKATKSVTANDISRQDIVASSTSENVDLDLPLGTYHDNEDYFLALSIQGQELIQVKFQITERLTDSGGEVILQYLSSDYTLSGNAISSSNKILDQNSKTPTLNDTSTNDQWASAEQIHDSIETAKPPEFYDFIVGASSQADYQYNGTDISVALNSAITALGSEGGAIYIEKGNYAIVNSINPTGKSNITIIGGGKKRTTITGNGLAVSYFNLSDSVNRFNTRLSDFTLDNTTPAVGSVGITFDKNKDGFFQNITVRNFETGYVLEDDTLYNNYINVDSENCKNDVIIKDQGLPSNSNNFYGCKFLADKNLVNGALGSHNPLSIEAGNQNTFTACIFENFTTGLNIDGVGNSFTTNRFESNDITGSVVYINFGANSKNNQFVSNYYSGNDWVNRTTSIVDNGDGNSFYEGNNFKDQFVQFTRNILTAGSVVEYKRTGSGDGHAIYNATDTFPNSGNPISYLASGVRPTHKFHSGELNGIESYYVNGSGLGFFGGGVNVDNNKIINVANPTNNQDAVNKDYVDTESNLALKKADNLSDLSDVSTARTNLNLGEADDVTFSSVRISNPNPPGSSSATGNQGEFRWSSKKLYLSTAPNQWNSLPLMPYSGFHDKVYVGSDSSCDYVTDGTDDQVQIQQAIDDTLNPSNQNFGKTIYLAPQNFNVNAQITANLTSGASLLIKGQAQGTNIINVNTSSAHTLQINGNGLNSNDLGWVDLQDITFVGSSASGMGCRINECFRGYTKNLFFKDFTNGSGFGVGLWSRFMINFLHDNLNTRNCAFAGIETTVSSNANTFYGGRHIYNGSNGVAIGSNGNAFYGTLFELTQNGPGVTLGSSNNNTLLSGCWIEFNNTYGITSQAKSLSVDSCWFVSNGQNAGEEDIRLEASSKASRIVGNKFNNAGGYVGKLRIESGADGVRTRDNYNLGTITDLGGIDVVNDNFLNV